MTPTTSSFTIGDTIAVPWRPGRPVKVTPTMYEAVYRLRTATIIAARRRSTITYGEAELAIDGLYIAQGLGPALDLLSHDCIVRGEPSLAALVVRKDSGKVGDAFVGDADLGRERCYEYWRRR